MIHFKPFKFGRAEWTVIIASFGLIVLGIGITTVPVVATAYARLNDDWTRLALQYGYWGAFLSALIGSITVILVFPYTLVTFFLATQGLNPFYLGVLMGLGAAIGQLSGYFLGLWGSRFFQTKKPETYDSLERIVHARPWMVQWLLFLFAVTPLPDDLLFIPLGMLRYGWLKVTLPTLLGKIISGLLVAYSSHFLIHVLNTNTAAPATAIVSQIGTFLALGLMLYLMFKLDWTAMMHRLLDQEKPVSLTELTKE